MRYSAVSLSCLVLALGSARVDAQKTARRPSRDSVHVLEGVSVTAAAEDPPARHKLYQAARLASRDSLLRELSAARQLWADHRGPHVTYRLQRLCGCIMSITESSDITVEAVGDSVMGLLNRREIPTSFRLWNGQPPTAASLFDLAEKAIRGNAEQVIVAFDPVLGIPTRLLVDVQVDVTDDEEDIVVTDIVVLHQARKLYTPP